MKKEKKSYIKPKLTAYGSLKDITSQQTCNCDRVCYFACEPTNYPDTGGTCPRTTH